MATTDSAHLVRPDPFLRADEVSFGYGTLTIVDRVSVDVGPGEIVALLGPNGAGKSTLVKGLIGHLPLLGGAVRLNGVDIGRATAPMRVCEWGWATSRKSGTSSHPSLFGRTSAWAAIRYRAAPFESESRRCSISFPRSRRCAIAAPARSAAANGRWWRSAERDDAEPDPAHP